MRKEGYSCGVFFLIDNSWRC